MAGLLKSKPTTKNIKIMTTSESIKSIAAALVGFHKEVGKIGKDANNPFFKSRYASLSNILEGIQEPMVNNGLSIVQFPEGDNGLTTRLVHTSGEWMEATYFMKPTKEDPQGRGAAISYQRRYAVSGILSLNIDDEDDDGESHRTGPLNGQQPAQNSAPDKPWLNKGTDVYKAAVDRLKSGQTTIEKISKAYRLNKEMREELEGYVPSNLNA